MVYLHIKDPSSGIQYRSTLRKRNHMRGLEGIKVVELTSYVAAPACPRILGEMGATVYKIEPASGDEYRTNGPGFGMEKTDIDDPAFDYASINKTFVSINLKSEEGTALLDKMLAEADIMVTSFRDKALVKLGLDWESIHARHPHLVWGQMRGYGDRPRQEHQRVRCDRIRCTWRMVRLPSPIGRRIPACQLARRHG